MTTQVQEPIQTLQLTGDRARMAQSLMDLMDQEGGASSGEPNVITQFLRWAEKDHFLVSPITAAPTHMLPGVEVQFTKVKIKTGPGDGEIYEISGQGNKPQDQRLFSLHKPGVDRIGLGRGINWTHSYRTDNGSVLFKVEWQVKGWYYSHDMQKKPVIGSSAIDLSEGSAGIMKIRAEQTSQNAGDTRIRMMRYKIVQLAETNARMRAIFGQGIKMAFTKRELENKFFICVQPVITGHCPGRPDLEEIYVHSVAANLAPNRELLYGGKETAASPSPTSMIAESFVGVEPSEALSAEEKAALDAQQQSQEEHIWIIPFGQFKDTPVNDQQITDSVLGRLVDYCHGAIADENQAANADFYTECRRELELEIDRRMKASKVGSIDDAASVTKTPAQNEPGIKL